MTPSAPNPYKHHCLGTISSAYFNISFKRYIHCASELCDVNTAVYLTVMAKDTPNKIV